MKQIIKIGVCVILSIALWSCGTIKIHTNTEPRDYAENISFKLNATHSVAIGNISSSARGIEESLCGVGAWKVMGNLYDYTETAIGIAKNALQRNHTVIDEKAVKTLKLSVDKASCGHGVVVRESRMTLKVRTGNGIEKEYKGSENNQHPHAEAKAFELIMAKCIEQMLNDKDIISYLEQ